MFLFGVFMPISLTLNVSRTLLEIIESIVEDNEAEQKSSN